MKFLSVCSGIEAASVAWSPLGWEAVGFSEIEPFPCAVLKHHYPEVPNFGDMTKFMEWPDATIDVLCGGTPCQSFSVAGLRRGLDDPRGNLMLTFLAIAKRYRPTWVVWENVPGVLSSNDGRDFGSFLGGLAECGYGFAYRVLDAQYFGLAQRRKRVFVVGHLGNWQRAAAVLFERESLCGHPAPSRKTGERVTPTVTNGHPFSRTGNDRVEADAMICADVGFSVTGAVTSGYGSRQGTDEVCQGSIIPCSVPTTSMCLNAKGGAGRLDAESETLLPVAFHPTQDPISSTEVCHSIGANLKPVTYDFFNITAPVNRQNRTPGDPCHTLARSNAEHAHLVTPMQVRRLTPVECERLQGFPDNYTAIPWRKKPVDLCPDGPRYKALGNSWAVPVVRWIGQRINMVEAINGRTTTLD